MKTPTEINIDSPVGALKTQLSKLLLSVDRVGWQTGSTTGRFDVRRTSRMLAGSERVFKSRTEVPATTTAVSIIIDMSSSMRYAETLPDGTRSNDVNDQRIGVAAQCAYAIATAVERSNCEVEVVGFGGGSRKIYSGATHGMNGLGGEEQRANDRTEYEESELFDIKTFGTRAANARRNFQLLGNLCHYCTPDYHAVRTVTDAVSARSEHRKIVLVLTDGMGSPGLMKQYGAYAKRIHNIPVFGIGIHTERSVMRSAYTAFACIKQLKDLTDIAIRSLIDQVNNLKVSHA